MEKKVRKKCKRKEAREEEYSRERQWEHADGYYSWSMKMSPKGYFKGKPGKGKGDAWPAMDFQQWMMSSYDYSNDNWQWSNKGVSQWFPEPSSGGKKKGKGMHAPEDFLPEDEEAQKRTRAQKTSKAKKDKNAAMRK